jgi:hypothetical protein
MVMRNAFTASVLLLAMFVTGCASVPMASEEQDAKAKTFAVPPGKSNIYVYRNENMGAAIKMPVILDGRMVGDTVAKSFLLLTVDPGKHSVVSKTEVDSTLDIVTERNKNYFVWQEVKMGMWAARSQLQRVDDQTGMKAVNECKLIQGM